MEPRLFHNLKCGILNLMLRSMRIEQIFNLDGMQLSRSATTSIYFTKWVLRENVKLSFKIGKQDRFIDLLFFHL